jgi:hypothetical protein
LLPFGNQLGSDDRDLARRFDAQPDLASFQSDDGDADVIADEQLLHQFPGQHQHVVSSSSDAERNRPGPPAGYRANRRGAPTHIGNLGHVSIDDRVVKKTRFRDSGSLGLPDPGLERPALKHSLLDGAARCDEVLRLQAPVRSPLDTARISVSMSVAKNHERPPGQGRRRILPPLVSAASANRPRR